jgi:hypothetical protein
LGTAAGAVYCPALEMVPFEAPPATFQVTAVFDVPLTVAVNGCVLPTFTLAVAGATDIVTAGLLLVDVLAQPRNKTHTQLRAVKKDARRMKILTEGRSPFSKTGVRKRTKTQSIHPWNWTTWLLKKMLGRGRGG